MGAGLPAIVATRFSCKTPLLPSRASPLPQGGAGKPRIQLVMHYLWELACLRCRRRGLAGTPQRCHREQARSHKGSWQATNSVGHALPVGAGLPAMQTARTGRYTAAMPSRVSPLPQVGAWQAANSVGHALPAGAGLPAMQAARTGRYTVAMPSRAGPLPHRGGFRFIRLTKIPSGKKSARPNPAGAANPPAPAGR